MFVSLPHTAQSSHCCSDHLRPTDGVSQPSRVQPVAVSCNDLAVPTQLTTDYRLNPRWWRNSRVTLLSLILLYFYGQISVIKGVYIISYIIPHCKVEKKYFHHSFIILQRDYLLSMIIVITSIYKIKIALPVQFITNIMLHSSAGVELGGLYSSGNDTTPTPALPPSPPLATMQ